jgi:nucleoside-diphosphate-sugar epimerase
MELEKGQWLFLHFAYLTRDKVSTQNLDDYISGNRHISSTVMHAMRHIGCAGLFMPSSGAVYTKDRMIDADMQANPYGVLKYEDEVAFSKLANELNCTAVIPRVFNLAGPFINKTEHYAISSMIRAVLSNQSISIRAAHAVVRSYTHVGDIISLALALMMNKNIKQHIFDTAGEKNVELSELAQEIIMVLKKDQINI